MVDFDKLEELEKGYKQDLIFLIGAIILLNLSVATLVISIVFKEIGMICAFGLITGLLIFMLMGSILSFKESREVYLEEERKVFEEIHKGMAEMFLTAIVEFDKAISKDIERLKVETDKLKAENKKPIKKVNTTSSVKNKAAPKKVAKIDTKK